MPDNQLTSLLSSLKLGATDVSEISNLAKTSNYQIACQRHFDVTHPGHLNLPELKVRGCCVVMFVVFLVRMCMQCVYPRPWHIFVCIHSFSVVSNTFIFIKPTTGMTVRRSGEPSEFVVPDLGELPQAEERQAHHLLVLLGGGARGARHRARREG